MKFEPFIIFGCGGIFLAFIIYVSKPSHPLLLIVGQHQFPKSQHQRSHLEVERNNLIDWKTTVNDTKSSISLHSPSNVLFSQEIEGLPIFVLPKKSKLLVIYYQIEEELISFKSRLYQISTQNYIIENQNSDINVEWKDALINGSLSISKCSWTYDDHLLYSRSLDRRLFRLLTPTPELPSKYLHQDIWKDRINGPLKTDFPGRILAFSYLWALPDHYAILVVQYIPFENEFCKISISIFSADPKLFWRINTLWETELEGCGQGMIQSDSVDYLYFLTNPIIAISDDAKVAAFVFIEHLFLISVDEVQKGYVLTTQRVEGLFGADFDIDLVYIFTRPTENLIVLVSEFNRLFVFSDKLNATLGFKDHVLEYVDWYLKSTWYFFDIILQGFVFLDMMFPLTDQKETFDFSHVVFPEKQHSFNLIGFWKNEFAGTIQNKIISIADKNSDENHELAVLLEDGVAVLLDTKHLDDSLPAVLFFEQKWFLLLALTAVILIFTLNEINFVHTPRSNFLFFSIIYMMLLGLTISTIFLENEY